MLIIVQTVWGGNEDNQEMPAQGMDRALLEWHGKIGL
jgi:hypothetical protein